MPENDLLRLSTKIVAAYLGNNAMPMTGVPDLIRSVHAALGSTEAPAAEAAAPGPAVPIKKSVFPGYIVCLEDGKKLTMLKRHLRTIYGMTPDDYGAKWGLPAKYPMVAPDYAARRSTLAKAIGLGQKKALPVPVALPEVKMRKVAAGVSGTKKPARGKAAPATEATSADST